MNNKSSITQPKKREQIITAFGAARLVQLKDGSVQLRGGEKYDSTAAKEWISLFMHEAVLRRN